MTYIVLISMTQKLFSRPYSIDIPQWQAKMDIIKVTFTVF